MIPFIKTNLAQACMTFETVNNLWGSTLNPWDKSKSSGGSSGGEGAIISSRCSFLGAASDIGGSIRNPALMCGIFGLKPTSNRISNEYFSYVSKLFRCLERVIPNSLGPLGRSSKDLALFMDATTNKANFSGGYDPYTKIIPFDWSKFLEVEINT